MNDLSPIHASRRTFLRGGVGVALASLFGRDLAAAVDRHLPPSLLGFAPITPSTDDTVRLPDGYTADVVIAWGDPVSEGGPSYRPKADHSAEEQQQQAGMHHDGMHFFSVDGSATEGILCINHEYVDDGLLHADGRVMPDPEKGIAGNWTLDKVRKSQAAVGVSIVHVRNVDGRWRVVGKGRRITAETEIRIAGPAKGSPSMRTLRDPKGEIIEGTFANCANGFTPWGTYLTCEENIQDYFSIDLLPESNSGEPAPSSKKRRQSAEEKAWELGKKDINHWGKVDPRFDATGEDFRNEPNRFGWVVEIDPFRPDAMPVKRTALGRFAHENCALTLAKDRRVVVYMGDDKKSSYIFKYVSNDPFAPGCDTSRLLDDGTLYVAQFEDGDVGHWIPMVPGPKNPYETAAETLIHARVVAKSLGATPMDRPEWFAIHPHSSDVYVSLTNNDERKDSAPGNPRKDNIHGHILRFAESDGDAASDTFRYSVFILAGDSADPTPERKSNIKPMPGYGPQDFGSPDGLAFDRRGVLWIQTDISTKYITKKVMKKDAAGKEYEYGDFSRLGNNQMLACDPRTGEVRRFLTGPRHCEITGFSMTPDQKTLFINIQHPGEEPTEGAVSDPANPGKYSTWPGGPQSPRPRSATLAIRRTDGGVIGA